MEYVNIPDFSGGNNLLMDAKQIGDNQTVRTKNLVPYAKGILEKRKGSVLYKEIAGATKINALQYTQISGDEYIVAVANFTGTGSEDKIYYSKNGGDFTEMTATSGSDTLTSNSDYTMVVDHLGNIYIANGTDNIQISSDGENREDLIFTTGSLYPNGKYLLWWKDRLWVAGDTSQPNAVYFSDNLDPTSFPADNVLFCGGKDVNDIITGIIPLTLTSANEGIIDVLAVFRKNSVWIIGFDTAPTYIDQLSSVIGCYDAKSICNTPMGVMFVGKENVYVLGRQGEPSPIGSAIKPVWDGSGIYVGRSTTHRTAVGIYFNGFVRFSYPATTSSNNNKEYYLDVRDLSNTGWFGDMTGRNLSCYLSIGTNLYAGDATNGKVWLLEQDIYLDDDKEIPTELKTKQYTLDGSEYTTKIFKRFGFNLLKTTSTNVEIHWEIDDGLLVGNKNFAEMVGSAVWDKDYWDASFFYGGSTFKEIKGIFSHQYRGRYINYRITEESGGNTKIQNGLMSYIPTRRIL